MSVLLLFTPILTEFYSCVSPIPFCDVAAQSATPSGAVDSSVQCGSPYSSPSSGAAPSSTSVPDTATADR